MSSPTRRRLARIAVVVLIALAALAGGPEVGTARTVVDPGPGVGTASPAPADPDPADPAAADPDAADPAEPDARLVTWITLPRPQRVVEGARWEVAVYLRLGSWVGGYGYLEFLQPDGSWRQHPEEKWIQGTIGQSWHTLTWVLTAAVEHAGQLRFRSWTGAGSGIVGHSDPVPVTVDLRPTEIVVQPVDRAAAPGSTAVFSVRMASAGLWARTTVQWEQSRDGGPWTAVPGATGVDHAVTASAETAATRYRAVVTRSRDLPPGTVPAVASAAVPGVVRSDEVGLRLLGDPPTVTVHPEGDRVVPGQPARVTAAASGTDPLRVRWRESVDGLTWTDVPGATHPTLEVPGPGLADDGRRYRAEFRNDLGAALTDPATLRVVTVPPLRLGVEPRVQRVDAPP
jgi:hypothetical protein